MPEPTSSQPLVDLQRVSVRFGERLVLREIDLEVPRGETLVLIGESGCGKTVLMKSIVGLVRPTTGTVHFDGQELADLNEQQFARLCTRFGFLFQNAALFDSLTVGQNVAFPLRQHREMEDDEVRRIVLDRLADVGLTERIVGQRPAELSGGMRKRVGLARALALEPELVLYDEPTTGLDPIMSDVINELILQTQERHHVTSVVVTHDMHTARKVGDRVAMLYPLHRLEPDEPQVIFQGDPDELETCPDARVRQFVRGEAGERLTELEESRMA